MEVHCYECSLKEDQNNLCHDYIEYLEICVKCFLESINNRTIGYCINCGEIERIKPHNKIFPNSKKVYLGKDGDNPDAENSEHLNGEHIIEMNNDYIIDKLIEMFPEFDIKKFNLNCYH